MISQHPNRLYDHRDQTQSHHRIPDKSAKMLHCHICEKPFTSATSHTRHVRYCMRTRNRPRVRQKSCQACSASKVKCTFRRPSCKRCEDKGLDCIYETASAPVSAESVPGFESAKPQPAVEEPITLESTGLEPWQTSSSGADQIDWSAIDFVLSEEFLSQHTEPEPVPNTGTITDPTVPDMCDPSFYSVTAPVRNKIDIDMSSWFSSPGYTNPWQLQQQLTPTFTTTPTPMDAPGQAAVLSLHRNQDPTVRFCALTIIRGIRAYPLMMLQKDTFPPFVHAPSLLASKTSETSGPGRIIARCMSIAHMYALRTPETSNFLWEAVHDQSTYFQRNMDTMPVPELLAAIEAQLVYIIMRVVAAATQPPGLNFGLMLVFKQLCDQFVATHDEPWCYQTTAKPPTRWEDWVVAESWRRMKCIFFLICRIANLDISPAFICSANQGQLDRIPLPAPKAQWEAKTEAEWLAQTSFSGVFRAQSGCKLDTVAALHEAHQNALDGSAEALDSWNVGADNLGSLLNASLGMVAWDETRRCEVPG
ncbi:hypothetical protein B0H66DRAFT_569290 [Apodospora peruviana]|uniref:Zn(2)-C6 fungal-type domain-containing protein n=1 Tax=Apodospora peruviana TaxID=516989 RepID=A0AAE0LZ31_9PEZI|nr:hypothetical protein B0H66DRAFT_569290 [Apodospora peruviana]